MFTPADHNLVESDSPVKSLSALLTMLLVAVQRTIVHVASGTGVLRPVPLASAQWATSGLHYAVVSYAGPHPDERDSHFAQTFGVAHSAIRHCTPPAPLPQVHTVGGGLYYAGSCSRSLMLKVAAINIAGKLLRLQRNRRETVTTAADSG